MQCIHNHSYHGSGTTTLASFFGSYWKPVCCIQLPANPISSTTALTMDCSLLHLPVTLVYRWLRYPCCMIVLLPVFKSDLFRTLIGGGWIWFMIPNRFDVYIYGAYPRDAQRRLSFWDCSCSLAICPYGSLEFCNHIDDWLSVRTQNGRLVKSVDISH